MLKNFLLLTAFSTFVVIVIVSLDVFHKYQISSLKENTQRRVVSISPNFDTETIEGLRERVPISATIEGKSGIISEDTSTGAKVTPTPSPTTLPSIIPTSSLQQQPTASGAASQ